MAIFYDDVKLMKSQRLDDSDEGGGRMTGNEVVDGEMNNLFPDISRLDRTYGRVQLRKAFPAILTGTDNVYYGGHVIITRPAQDQNVKCCLFTTRSSTDRRKDAIDRLEQYVVKGYRLFTYILMGKHVAGASALLIEQDTTDELPSVNEVFYLIEQDDTNAEYVKVKEVKITKEQGNRRQVELTLWSSTQYDHDGFHYQGNWKVIDTYFYNTVVADAMKYYGLSKLAQPANKNDSTVKVQSIFHQLVPTAQSNAGLSQDALPAWGETEKGTEQSKIVASGSFDTNNPYTIHCLRPVVAGTLSFTAYYNFEDDGNGNIIRAGTKDVYGSVDYATGRIEMQAHHNGTQDITVTAIPGAQPTRQMYTAEYPITPESRTNTFVKTFIPPILPGSFILRFRAQGKWYVMYDQGDGTIKGINPAYGSGTIDYSTNTINVTIGALPDVGSSVFFQWATNDIYEARGGGQSEDPYIELTTQHPISPGTLEITYTAGGQQRTVNDDGNGNLTGDGSGKVDYSAQEIILKPTHLPDTGTAIYISYNETHEKYSEQYSQSELTSNDGTWTITLGHSILAGTLELTIEKLERTGDWDPPEVTNFKLKDDGNGHFVGDSASSINYTTGQVTFSKQQNIYALPWHWEKKCYIEQSGCGPSPGGCHSHQVCHRYKVYDGKADKPYTSELTGAGNTFTFEYSSASTQTSHDEEITDYQIKLKMHTLRTHGTVPSSLWLSWNDKDEIIDDEGKLYDGRDAETGALGAQIGYYDYEAGIARFTTWQSGVTAVKANIISAVMPLNQQTTTGLVFTSAGDPIQVGSFQLVFTRADTAEQKTVTADNSGYINGEGAVGYVNYNLGLISVNFGEWVPKSGNEDKPWYDERFVNGDQVLKPIPVYANSIRYNCVIINFIPLDPSILGLNPLRLPTDGKVPIFRTGDIIVIHNIQSETLPNNLSAGQQIQLSRGDLSYVDLFDQNGKYVNKNWYSVNLETGVITMADPLDLSEYEQPLIAWHRREDMRLLTDVQIDGTLTLIQPIEHDYDTDFTYVSSALLMGDLYASVYNVFDQKNWTGEWSDELIGDPCTASYNLVDYPIEVTNKGAIAERWALIFTDSENFKIVGETVGEIATGNINQDCAPINPATQTPYFTIKAAGWGSGWAANNVLRFNTTAAHYPVWFVRTVLIGDATSDDDNFKVQIRGDAD